MNYGFYRKSEFEQFKKALATLECFTITGSSGVGKSRFIRNSIKHLSETDSNTLIFMLDVNSFTSFDVYYIQKSLLTSLNSHVKNKTCDSVEVAIKYFKESKGIKSIVVVLDEFQNLPRKNIQAINYLRSLRDSNKTFLRYIFSYPSDFALPKSFSKLTNISSITIDLQPLNHEDCNRLIHNICTEYSINIDDIDRKLIVKASNGIPKDVKNLCFKRLINPSHNYSSSINFEQVLHVSERFLTKNEYLFLKDLLEVPGRIVPKDKFAFLLSPESKGAGVSDMAISQNIKRLRKKLNEYNIELEIKTKRGLGYFVEK